VKRIKRNKFKGKGKSQERACTENYIIGSKRSRQRKREKNRGGGILCQLKEEGCHKKFDRLREVGGDRDPKRQGTIGTIFMENSSYTQERIQ
jgi:hypothetical protein